MTKLIKTMAFSVAALFLSSNVAYAAHCGEKVTRLIIHRDGNVYFSTDKTCVENGWCKLDFEDPKQADRGYSMLLSATIADKKVTFTWPAISNCDEINAQHASPEYFDIRP
ncbi:hypothetical protein ACL7TT_14710 [Microbulbifer sp. 2304DJ12-6]|uniref:hypothetical protein n=1 Tax=Microbulbifer sp. 2304DJ12-6 TaxID=3233340 RepID=UPI0039B0F46A